MTTTFSDIPPELLDDDDARMHEDTNLSLIGEWSGTSGHITQPILQHLWGLPWCNLVLAHLRGFHPTAIRVSKDGGVCTDAFPRRITVYLVPGTRKVERIEQETSCHYACGYDIHRYTKALRAQFPHDPPCDD